MDCILLIINIYKVWECTVIGGQSLAKRNIVQKYLKPGNKKHFFLSLKEMNYYEYHFANFVFNTDLFL